MEGRRRVIEVFGRQPDQARLWLRMGLVDVSYSCMIEAHAANNKAHERIVIQERQALREIEGTAWGQFRKEVEVE